MSLINVELQGAAQIQNNLNNYPSISEPIFQKAIEGTAAIFAKNTLKDDPVPWRTGALLQTFQFGSSRLQAFWQPTRAYAIFVHDGTAPHIIQAVNKKVLANKATGQIFGKVVHHPGNKANPFMPKIRDKSADEVNRLFGQALDMVAREIAKQ